MMIQLKDKFITIFVYFSIEEFLKKNKIEVEENTTGLCHFERDKRIVNICVFNNKISTLSHEIFHAIDVINSFINEKSSVDVYFSESNAYLVGFLTNEILKKKKGLDYE